MDGKTLYLLQVEDSFHNASALNMQKLSGRLNLSLLKWNFSSKLKFLSYRDLLAKTDLRLHVTSTSLPLCVISHILSAKFG